MHEHAHEALLREIVDVLLAANRYRTEHGRLPVSAEECGFLGNAGVTYTITSTEVCAILDGEQVCRALE